MSIPADSLADAIGRLARAFRAVSGEFPGLELDARPGAGDLAGYLHIGVSRAGQRVRPLCRLRWCGDPADWDLELWSPMEEAYDRNGGKPIEGGTPEVCLRAVLESIALDPPSAEWRRHTS